MEIKLKKAERVTNYCEAGMWGHVVTFQWMLKMEIKLRKAEGWLATVNVRDPSFQWLLQVEIKLKKAEGVQWTKLEGDGQKFGLKLPSTAAAAGGG